MNDLLQVTWQMEYGLDEKDTDLNNPLSRALSRLMFEGKPIDGLSIALFGDITPVGEPRENPRWLGIFVLGRRIVFFPGFTLVSQGVQTFRGTMRQRQDATFITDHVSLERDLKSWHATSPGSENHLTGGKTISLGQGRVLWLGMSVAAEAILRPMRKKTIIHAQVPSGDVSRRADVFKKARENATFPLVSLHPSARGRFNPAFLHFAFIVGERGFPAYTGEQSFALPFGSPFVAGEAKRKDLEQLPVRSHRLSIGQQLDIELLSMLLPGTMATPICFTSIG